ncbi:hypothetical protein [Haladaptatus sp. CMAA 1911]|uniref:hypothetical protein n=1 Tax=unclassified Haladaptatus TaxID=2622732 RepID=UPI003754CFD6
MSSYVLAGLVLVVAVLVVGILDPIPVPAVLSSLASGTLMSDDSLSLAVLVGLPFVLALVVLLRSASRTPVEIVLGLLAVPCLLVGLWVVYDYAVSASGVYWGGPFTIASGSILAFVVLVDAGLSYFV